MGCRLIDLMPIKQLSGKIDAWVGNYYIQMPNSQPTILNQLFHNVIMLPFEKYCPLEVKQYGEKNWDRDAYKKMLDLCRRVDFKEHEDMAALLHPLLDDFNVRTVDMCNTFEQVRGAMAALCRNKGIKRYPLTADWTDVSQLDRNLSRLTKAVGSVQSDYPALIQVLLLNVDLNGVIKGERA